MRPGRKARAPAARYFHCATRACGFFTWADNGHFASSLKMAWQWFCPAGGWRVVAEDGVFRATDLAQGGVGDCWFVSALAVVAERPDLIAKLGPLRSDVSLPRHVGARTP